MDNGSKITKKNLKSLHPSICDASVSSEGILLIKNVLVIIILYVLMAPGSMIAHIELIKCSCVIKIYEGIKPPPKNIVIINKVM